VSSTYLHMANGERLKVKGALEDVEKTLGDAARSGQSRLAWLTDAETDTPVGVNPVQVSTVSAGSDPASAGPSRE
jgi:hypothetical protein